MKPRFSRVAPAWMPAAATFLTWASFAAANAPDAADTPRTEPGGAAGDASVGSPAPDSTAARAVFERLKTLTGEWRGRSTKGWEDEATYRVIAAGSVVMSTSFDAHPNETMVTMFYLDVGKLRLIHYCVAGNQPGLVATRISDDGRDVTFTFDGGGNLPTRDRGHMDKAVLQFIDDDRLTSRWTWYQDGQEQWMEEIEYRRSP